MSDTIIVLPGDCIGPEITEEALRVLDLLSISYEVHEAGLGAAALRETGKPLADETRNACLNATAVLKAPVGFVPRHEIWYEG